MKKNIILMGPPGAGKGTLATQLKEAFHLVHISTGDMFREAIKGKTELGLLAQSYMVKGDLVPDDVVIGIVKDRLIQDDCKDGFLLDGFPRTLAQAEALSNLTKEIAREIDAVINVCCEEEVLVERISTRRVCPKCGAPFNVKSMKPKVEGICDYCGTALIQRPDDTVEALKVRLSHYNTDTYPLIKYYTEKGIIKDFDSSRGKEVTFDEVSRYLKA